MARQTWPETLISIGESGTALTNSTTPTNILPDGRLYTLPSYAFEAVGQGLGFWAAGVISTVVTTPGTLTLDIMFGSIAVASSGAMSLNTTAQTTVGWELFLKSYVRVIGSGTNAKLRSQGFWKSHAVIGSPAPTAGGCGTHILPYNAAPADGNGYDGTSSQQISLRATWSVANASNSIQCHAFDAVSLN